MLRSMLIGLDGSEYSDAAVELALRWAHQYGATLAGLGIVDEPGIRRPAGLMIGSGHYKAIVDEQHLADAQQKVREFLDRFDQRCKAEQVPAKCLQQVGLPHAEIVEEAQRYDLIMLGQQSYFTFESNEGPGETLHRVLHHTPRPVVTVPATLPSGRSVVVAYDGSLPAARALQAFVATELWRNVDLHLLNVAGEQSVGEAAIERAAEFLGYHDIAFHRHCLVSDTSPGVAILQQASQLDAGLVVMGAYGKPATQAFFFGSATKTVLKQTTIPLMLYH